MTKARTQGRVARAALFVAMAGQSVLGCSDDGTTPNCPDLPLYDVSDPQALTPDVVKLRNAAIAAGCSTALGTGGIGAGGGASAVR